MIYKVSKLKIKVKENNLDWKKYKINGKKIKVKVSRKVDILKKGKIMFKWQRPEDDNWLYSESSEEYKNVIDFIENHFFQNLETNNVKLKILEVK